MTVSVITPTADRPIAFALCERWMARQTRPPDEWIVADGGRVPTPCTRGQVHLEVPYAVSLVSFAQNLLAAIAQATGDLIICIEDDDWYAPMHLERIVDQLAGPTVLIAGDDEQRYYNLPQRCWRVFNNVGASLCQTAFHRALLPQCERAIRDCLARGSIGIDRAFWMSVPKDVWSLQRIGTVVGIKGLPGRRGLGIGHRPDHQWTADPTLAALQSWLGPDADAYTPYTQRVA